MNFFYLNLINNLLSFDFHYGKDIVRGVNLGGWLVTEPWITPSLYEPHEHLGVVDEYTMCQKLGTQKCKEILEPHWNSFVTEVDIIKIKEAGLNHVRIPIGYWAFETQEGDPYCQGQIPHFKRVLDLCRNHGIKVIIDLHGAPGSQNGFDNSGQRLEKQLWTSKEENIQKTLNILKLIVKEFKPWEDITSLAILNEPHGGQMDLKIIEKFYLDAHKIIRDENSSQFIWLGDGFFPQNWTQLKLDQIGLDSHFYHVFDYGMLKANLEDHNKVLDVVCKARKDQLSSGLNGEHYQIPHIVGEWSGATTDCAKWLNGVGRGTRWEGSYENGQSIKEGLKCSGEENFNEWSEEKKLKIKKYIQLQMSSFELGGGWIFWNFKNEQADTWNYLKGVEMGYIPKNPSQLEFKC